MTSPYITIGMSLTSLGLSFLVTGIDRSNKTPFVVIGVLALFAGVIFLMIGNKAARAEVQRQTEFYDILKRWDRREEIKEEHPNPIMPDKAR